MSNQSSRRIDLSGLRSGKLLVSHRYTGKRRTAWVCFCDCKQVRVIATYHLRGEHPQTSCGCETNRVQGTVIDRFWAKVSKTDVCWEWTGSVSPGGYGQFRVSSYRLVGAHRFSWELHGNDLPADQEICHACDNRRCIRPDHLFPGTHSDNMQDALRKGRLVHQVRSHIAERGENINTAKLTRTDVVQARALVASGVTKSEVARRFGVRTGTISRAVIGRTWRHVREGLPDERALAEEANIIMPECPANNRQ